MNKKQKPETPSGVLAREIRHIRRNRMWDVICSAVLLLKLMSPSVRDQPLLFSGFAAGILFCIVHYHYPLPVTNAIKAIRAIAHDRAETSVELLTKAVSIRSLREEAKRALRTLDSTDSNST